MLNERWLNSLRICAHSATGARTPARSSQNIRRPTDSPVANSGMLRAHDTSVTGTVPRHTSARAPLLLLPPPQTGKMPTLPFSNVATTRSPRCVHAASLQLP